MSALSERIQAAVDAVRKHSGLVPKAGIILGTGLGCLAEDVEEATKIPYTEIPGLPPTTFEAHAGTLLLGKLSGVPVAVLEGRYHYYEGHSLQTVTLPVRIVRALGAEVLIVSNAAGGMNPQHGVGDIIVLDDHIALFGPNVLAGENDDELGPRFPDMSAPFNPLLRDRAVRIALEEGVRAHTGVYVWVTGPSLETRAEYRMLRFLGADVVGMSTVPEVLAAVHGGMRVVGFSVITDMCLPDALAPAKIEEIIAVANEGGGKLARIIKRLVGEL